MEKPKDDLDAVRILVATLESFDKEARERIIRWAGEKLGMYSTIQFASAPSALPRPTLQHGAESQATATRSMDLKSFVEEKSPKNDMHFAVTAAYYYLHEVVPNECKETIDKDVLAEAVRIVKWRRGLNHPGQTLLNAFNAGLLDKTSDRGEFKLNMVGKNLVGVLLPESGTAPQTKKPARRTKKKLGVRKKASAKNKKGKTKTTRKTSRKK